MDADPAVSADLVLVALDAPRSHPPPALPCHVTRAGPPPVGPVRSTPERTNHDADKTKIGYDFINKFSFSFIKTTARAATTFLINQWLAMAAEWRKD
jgi:hypothetical protein